MEENKATEIAYKNGYKKGSEDTAEKILKEVGKVCGDYQWFKNLRKQYEKE